MSRLARAIRNQLRWMLACLAISVVVLAGVGLRSLTISTGAADRLYHDKLRTLQVTSALSDGMRDAYEQAVAALTELNANVRRSTTARLFDETIPQVDVQLAALRQLPTIDSQIERTEVARISASWTALREAIVPDIAQIDVDQRALLARVKTRGTAITSATARLDAQEQSESAAASDQAHAAWREGVVLILVAAGGALLVGIVVMMCGTRKVVGRAVADEAAQQEFVHAMQLTRDEEDAYRVMSRHLDRAVPHSHSTILNRNNSADRLEAMTSVPSTWPLARHLDGARPDSCAAIRSARAYSRRPTDKALVACDLCSTCPEHSACNPITVSGQIIGSVLITRNRPFDDQDHARIDLTVAQGAPVLANLRNLAIAEFRAATDALTGLPNKRALAHTLKRMVAQASRTVTPLAVLSLDLDHFKQINDQYGHPAGDQVLAAVGAALQATMRESDFAGRNGGEEFLVLLPATDQAGARLTAERIATAIGDIHVPNVDRRITASIGISVLPDDAGDADRLERAADRALYTAKSNGRDRIEITNRSTSADRTQ